ncbi:glutathionylspermidine synthase family protein [Alkalihalobacillus sp. MEB130]|uniref:glutathionylspermidine synthase family protein n=1 Tax=Alkalihalobacillus sp. MEB130 TaxID=2976704 RepID=UPI0028DD9BBD|nr:glutathionylspermidine synthase family protein [Alkalihalobacillus sp. MEB130]MDT8860360.1 glutathionylspermidine synthase family protein [Alkalihalobacillus sp. MEB130]
MADNHTAKRDEFYETISTFWDRLYGMEYALYDCLELSDTDVADIRTATKEAYNVYKKMVRLIRQASDETLIDLGFPGKALEFLRMQLLPYETVIGRFDFVQTKDGLKILEFNADTPTFIRELFDVNGHVCQEFRMTNPNAGEDDYLGKSIRNSVFHCARQIGVTDHPYVVFTAHEEDVEDRETMMYLMNVSQIKGARFVPLSMLQVVAGDGVYDSEGMRIDVVYRHTYPLEALLEDVTDDEYPIGIEFMRLVERRKVGMLNPVSAFLMQSKAVMAAIWGMHEQRHPLFTEEEHKVISRYFLPTYLDEEPFLASGVTYVSKPAFGREGDTVEVRRQGETLFQQKAKSYAQYVKVFQQYVDLPSADVQTEIGTVQAHLLIGSFVVNEKPSAFGIRAGAQITDNLSYFLPCGVKGANEWT